jgi:hypothetical protein
MMNGSLLLQDIDREREFFYIIVFILVTGDEPPHLPKIIANEIMLQVNRRYSHFPLADSVFIPAVVWVVKASGNNIEELLEFEIAAFSLPLFLSVKGKPCLL